MYTPLLIILQSDCWPQALIFEEKIFVTAMEKMAIIRGSNCVTKLDPLNLNKIFENYIVNKA
jgi:hypothetical protein